MRVSVAVQVVYRAIHVYHTWTHALTLVVLTQLRPVGHLSGGPSVIP